MLNGLSSRCEDIKATNFEAASVLQNIAKQRDVRRWSNLNCAFWILLIGMGDFKRCAVNSPLRLGVTDFCYCDSDRKAENPGASRGGAKPSCASITGN